MPPQFAPFCPSNMFQTNTNYDRGVNVFNPEGRLFQVEYAIEAIKLGTTAIGIKCKDGVVLAVEKKNHIHTHRTKFLEETSRD